VEALSSGSGAKWWRRRGNVGTSSSPTYSLNASGAHSSVQGRRKRSTSATCHHVVSDESLFLYLAMTATLAVDAVGYSCALS
jgi:hypothetical protein